MAVLRAPPGFYGDDALDLDLRAAPAHTHVVGEREGLGDPLVGKTQHGERLRLVKALAAPEHLIAGDVEDLVVGDGHWWSCLGVAGRPAGPQYSWDRHGV